MLLSTAGMYGLMFLKELGLVVAMRLRIRLDPIWDPVMRFFSGAPVLFDLAATVLFLVWAYGVYARLKGLHPRYGRSPFWPWAVGCFIPVVSIFSFSSLQRRLWNVSAIGLKRNDLRVRSKVVAGGLVCRWVAWLAYAGMTYFALQSHFGATAVERGAGAAGRRVSRVAWDRSVGALDDDKMLMHLLGAIFAVASAAALWLNYHCATAVHDNMMASQDAEGE